MSPLEKLVTALDQNNKWEGEQSLKRGDYLTRPGAIDTKLYFIESGCVRVFFSDGEQEPTIRLGYANNLIVAMDSFVSGQPTELSLEALKSTRVKWMTKKVYMDFIKEDTGRLNAWMQGLESLVFQQLEREKDILTPSPQERLNRVLARSPQLFQEVPHKYIASYLRMTPETLSRLDKG